MPFAVEAQTAQVLATVETTPVPSSRDAADDPAIWVHPTDPAQSTIIGTDKRSGLAVYDLTGAQLQFIAGGTPNNVDLRYNFPLGGQSVALVGVSDTAGKKIDFYRVNPTTRLLETVVAQTIATGIKPYGFCMYHSPGGKYYAFVLSTSAVADVQQWELFDNGSGKVSATKVRSFTVGSTAEGCVADDYHRVVYLAEENVGIWKYGAEPEDGTSRTQVDAAGASGHLEEDVEGLTIYYASQGTGYLIASSQGNSTFVVYTRVPRPQATAYVKTFKIGEGNGIDRVQGTDGIEVLSFPLGSAFPQGLFVAQDGDNSGGNQNFKLVPWEGIAHTGSPQLTIDPTCDPRKTGAGGGGSQC